MLIKNSSGLYRMLRRLPLWLPFVLLPARLGNRMDLVSEVKPLWKRKAKLRALLDVKWPGQLN